MYGGFQPVYPQNGNLMVCTPGPIYIEALVLIRGVNGKYISKPSY